MHVVRVVRVARARFLCIEKRKEKHNYPEGFLYMYIKRARAPRAPRALQIHARANFESFFPETRTASSLSQSRLLESARSPAETTSAIRSIPRWSLTSDHAHCFLELVIIKRPHSCHTTADTYIQFTSAVMRAPSRRAEGSFGHTHTTRLHLVLAA
jgi:hypothetical protein